MRRPPAALLAAVLAGAAVLAPPAVGQEPPPQDTTTTTEAPPTSEPPITLPPIDTTTTTAPPPDDPGAVEEVPDEPVPTIDETVPTEPGAPSNGAAAGRILRQELHVAEADAVTFKSTYEDVKARVVKLEAEVDGLETGLTTLAAGQRDAVRRVAAAREQFEARAAARALVRGRPDDLSALATMDDPNQLAVADTLLGSVLRADQSSLDAYTTAKRETSAGLVAKADRLVDARHELEGARGELVVARRANVAAQFNLAVFAAGSDIVIHGFVFPVGDPHTFGDSFGAPRMMGTTYQHAHQGTDILAPKGTPLLACERGIVTQMGSDVLGGTKLWVKGQSGTYYYYAHLSAFAPDMADGTVVAPGDIVGFVGTTGNAQGGPAHLHFEIHPDGGPAVNPYPLLKVVDDLARAAEDKGR